MRGIRLVSQDQPTQTRVLNDVIWSMEFAAPKGVKYSPLGVGARYGSLDRIVSTEDRGQEQMTPGAPPVQQWELDIPSQEDRDQLLWNGILESSNLGFNAPYTVLKGNCLDRLFGLLDRTLRYSGQVPAFDSSIVDAVFENSLTPILNALKLRDLLNNSSALPTLNEETGMMQ